jgi:hypothetical protein
LQYFNDDSFPKGKRLVALHSFCSPKKFAPRGLRQFDAGWVAAI